MSSLLPIDYLILIIYLGLITFIGIWCHRSQRTTDDFLFAGRNIGWLPMGISIAASFISGITYIGLPAEVASHGLGILVYSFSYVLTIPVITRLFLPFYSSLRITTAYEYLEGRFDRRVRLFCSGIFIIWRLLWISTVIYVPSLVVSTVAGAPFVPSLIAIGLLTTVYTAVGGLRAVIVTDAIQFFIMAGGAVAAIVFASTAVPDGLAGIVRISAEQNRTAFANLSFDPSVRITVWGALLGGFFANLTFFGVDQMVIQRYLSTRSHEEMKRTFLLNCVALFLVVGLLAMLGLALFAFYHLHPDALPAGAPNDHILPYFIAHEFPPGLRGLLVASIFAASMSALSAGVNAATTAVFNDFMTTRRGLAAIRWLSVAIGLFCTTLASAAGKLGSIMEIAVRVIDGFAGPLLAIFLVGMLTRTVGANAVLIGGGAGLLITAAVNFLSSISFIWYAAIGCLSTVAVSLVVHWMTAESTEVKRAALRNAD